MFVCIALMALCMGGILACLMALVVLRVRERAERRRGGVPAAYLIAALKDFSEISQGGINYFPLIDEEFERRVEAIKLFYAWVSFAAAVAVQGYPAFGYRGLGPPYDFFDKDDDFIVRTPLRCIVTKDKFEVEQ